MTTKELIRAEIKKLQDIFVETAKEMETEDEAIVYSMCAVEFGDELLSFLDTLPNEPVTCGNELTGKKTFDDYLKASPSERRKMNMAEILGEERLSKTKRTMESVTDCHDLEEAADDHIRKVVDAAGHPGWDWETQDIADAFKAGAEWQKTKMMDDSYEEDVQEVYRDDDGIHCSVSVGTDYKPGTIVYVITIPKEDAE